MIDTNLVKSTYFATIEKLKFFRGTLKELENHRLCNDLDIIPDLKKMVMTLEIRRDTLKYVLSLDGQVGISELWKI